MAHRKFVHPRHGSMKFSPRKRARRHHGKIRSFPVDNPGHPVHMTAFMGYKAGMTHCVLTGVLRNYFRRNYERINAATVIECPPMIIVGIVGYYETPRGLKSLATVWADHIGDECRRIFYKNWYRSKKKAFTRYAQKAADPKGKKIIASDIRKIKAHCQIIRVLAHTQTNLLNMKKKKADMIEIQINGGTVEQKVDWAISHFEKPIRISEIFKPDTLIDTIGVTKGHGTEGTIKRFGVRHLPRKTYKGFRKVACIGASHPASVMRTVPRAGQHGYHHRTMMNSKVLKIGIKGMKDFFAMTDKDPTEKGITPMGGFPNYGIIEQDYIMLKGQVTGCSKRPIILREALCPRRTIPQLPLSFIDTSSKIGKGRFQTPQEKHHFFSKS